MEIEYEMFCLKLRVPGWEECVAHVIIKLVYQLWARNHFQFNFEGKFN